MWSPLLRPDAGALAAREEALEAMVEACTAKPRRPTGRPGVCQRIQGGFARCRLCLFRFPTDDLAAAHNTMTKHFRGHHKGHTPAGVPDWHQQQPSLVVPLTADQNCAWKLL